MSKKGYEPPLGLDMSFSEAMRRFAQTDPNEIKGDNRLEKKKKKKTIESKQRTES